MEEVFFTVSETAQILQVLNFVGSGKHHMEIGCVDHLSPALIHPDFLINSLAARTVSVPAGIIADLYMAAIRTL